MGGPIISEHVEARGLRPRLADGPEYKLREDKKVIVVDRKVMKRPLSEVSSI